MLEFSFNLPNCELLTYVEHYCTNSVTLIEFCPIKCWSNLEIVIGFRFFAYSQSQNTEVCSTSSVKMLSKWGL